MTRTRLLSVLALALSSACGPAGPAVLEFVSMVPAQPRIGEITTLTFKATDARGEPAAGQSVKFSIPPEAEARGAAVSPAESSTQKGSGLVTVQLTISGRVGSVVVKADADGKVAYSPSISFANSGVPNAKQFTFQCGPFGGDGNGGVHALNAYDSTRNLIAGTRVNCWAHVGDRNSDGVPGALVSFLTEAGTITPTATSGDELIGEANALYKITFPFPRETDPGVFTWNPVKNETQTGEYIVPLWMHPYEWQQNPVLNYGMPPNNQEPRRRDPVRKSMPQPTNNPRDNLVTMIAVTAGEEGFTDLNNDGQWQQGEPFDDLTEPFVDSNDDGTWDDTERYIDLNGNGTWDGKNGTWDANTLIWVQEKITWTGIPGALDIADTTSPVFSPTRFFPNQACADVPIRVQGDGGVRPGAPQACPSCTPCINFLSSIDALFVLSDPWFNTIAQNSEQDGCTIVETEGMAIIKTIPSKPLGGRLVTYPPAIGVSFSIGDSRNPTLPLEAQADYRNPPIKWITPLRCDFTSSPTDGYTINLFLGSLEGYIQ